MSKTPHKGFKWISFIVNIILCIAVIAVLIFNIWASQWGVPMWIIGTISYVFCVHMVIIVACVGAGENIEKEMEYRRKVDEMYEKMKKDKSEDGDDERTDESKGGEE